MIKNYIVLKNLSICSDGSVIIVAGYVTFLKKFEKVDEDIIPSLQSEKSALKSKIHELRENQVEEYMEICDKIKQIQQKIRSLKQEKKNYSDYSD